MKRFFRLLLSLLALFALWLMAACSGAPGCPQASFGGSACTGGGGGGSFSGGGGGGGSGGGGGGGVDASQASALIYYGSGVIDAAGVTSTGAFGTLNSYTAPTLAGNAADDMIIVNKKFLYIPMGDLTVVGYSINRSTGALTLIPGSPFTVPGGVGSADDVATDPLGRFLFVGSESGANIWVFQINAADGQLTATAGSPFTAGFALTGVSDIMAVDASGRFLYAGQLDPTLGVAAFSIDQISGALTALSGSPLNIPIAQLHASPTQELLLGVQEVQDGTTSASDPHIYVYAINSSTGALTAISGSPFLTGTGNAPFDFAISPNGNFVYAVEAAIATSSDAPIEGFSLNTTTGTLSSLGTFSGVPTSEGCKFDQSGVFLFCIDLYLGGSTLSVNAADPTTGALTHETSLGVSTDFPFAVTD